MNLETRIYQALLKLYPRAFRREYGEEMTRVFQENLASESSSFKLWIQTFADVFSSASREHVQGGRMFQRVAAISGVLMAATTLVRLRTILQNPQALVASTFETILIVSCVLAVLVAILLRPKMERDAGWWITVITIPSYIVCLALAFSFADKMPGSDVISKAGNLLVFGLLTLTTIRRQNKRFSIQPTFWGLLLLGCASVVQWWSPPIMIDPATMKFVGGVEPWLIWTNIIFSIGFVLLGLALWFRASKPQPRALT
jgi:hypothetical protein